MTIVTNQLIPWTVIYDDENWQLEKQPTGKYLAFAHSIGPLIALAKEALCTLPNLKLAKVNRVPSPGYHYPHLLMIYDQANRYDKELKKIANTKPTVHFKGWKESKVYSPSEM